MSVWTRGVLFFFPSPFLSFLSFFPSPSLGPVRLPANKMTLEAEARPGEQAPLLFRRVARCGAQTAAFSQPVGGVCRHGPSLGCAHSAGASLQREAMRAAHSPSNSHPLGFTADSSLCVSVCLCVCVCVCVRVWKRLTSTLRGPL